MVSHERLAGFEQFQRNNGEKMTGVSVIAAGNSHRMGLPKEWQWTNERGLMETQEDGEEE